MEEHRENLHSLCRICTHKLGKFSYSCSAPGKGGETPLVNEFTSTIKDQPDIHPPRYCNACHITLGKMRKAREDRKVYRTSLTVSPHVWLEHQEVGCTTCAMVGARSIGGRPRKKKRILGCPSYLTDHIRRVAGPRYRCSVPLTKDRFLPVSLQGIEIEDLVCKSCGNVVDEVVELACKHSLCCTCCFSLLTSNIHSFPCPHCQQAHPLACSSFLAPSPITLKILHQLVISCEKVGCTKTIYLGDLQAHLTSNCTLNSDLRNAITLLEQPTSIPPTHIEMETAGHVVRKILSQSTQGQASFSLPTGGCVSKITHVHYVNYNHAYNNNSPSHLQRSQDPI